MTFQPEAQIVKGSKEEIRKELEKIGLLQKNEKKTKTIKTLTEKVKKVLKK